MKQLAIANPIESAVIPKPTKSEVIEALTRLKVAELRQEIQERETKLQAIKKKLEPKILSLALKQARTAKVSYDMGWLKGDGNGVYSVDVEIPVDILPPEIEKALFEYHTLKSEPFRVDEKAVRKSISASMHGRATSEERVALLLNTPESNEALKKILKALEEKP